MRHPSKHLLGIAWVICAVACFAMLGGWWVFSHIPDRWSILGMALIATCGAAGAWLTMAERRRAAPTLETAQ